jgi:hypothetical protein
MCAASSGVIRPERSRYGYASASLAPPSIPSETSDYGVGTITSVSSSSLRPRTSSVAHDLQGDALSVRQLDQATCPGARFLDDRRNQASTWSAGMRLELCQRS